VQRDLVEPIEVDQEVQVSSQHQQIVERHQLLRLLEATKAHHGEHDLLALEPGHRFEKSPELLPT